MTALAWTKDDPVGVEFADARVSGDSLSAVGVAIGSEPVPYRLDYVLETSDRFVTTRLLVAARGDGWRRHLDLRRGRAGRWQAATTGIGATSLPEPVVALGELEGALDVDLALSPLTNTMPVLREQLGSGDGPADFVMAWVSVPDLGVTPSRQRYTVVRAHDAGAVVRFDDLDGGFTADIAFDADGFVVDYPGIARRL